MALLLALIAAVGLIVNSGSPDYSDSRRVTTIPTNAGARTTNDTSCAAPKRHSVYEALNELFNCLMETHVEPSASFREAAARIKFGRLAGSGAIQAPLLSGVFSTEALITGHRTHRQFYELAPLFPPELGRNESRGPEEAAKLDAYLSYLEGSPYVIDTYRTLRSNDALAEDSMSLRDFVRQVMFSHWFKPYGRHAKQHRRGVMDSSGFGHVFVGEVSSREVTGFHNWLSILAAEESGVFQYKGFVKVVTQPLLLASIQFGWLGRQKSLSSVAFGVETEFQLALFSACFVVKPGRKTRLRIAGSPVAVQTYTVGHQPESVASAHFVF